MQTTHNVFSSVLDYSGIVITSSAAWELEIKCNSFSITWVTWHYIMHSTGSLWLK